MEHTHHQSASKEDNCATREQEPEDTATPPSTVLVQWNKELLLLDAWNEEGDKLRTPPSLIGEAIKHFRIGKKEDIDNYRLAVHEFVDGQPALLFLGLTALRFIENGRVLELIDTRTPSSSKYGSPILSRSVSPSTRPDASATETFATAPLAHERSDISSDLSTVTSSESDISHEDYDHQQNPEKLSPRTIFFIQGAKQARKQEREAAKDRDHTLIRDESDTTLAGNSHDGAEVYVHPQHGAVFRRRNKRIIRTQAAHRDTLTYGDLKDNASMAQAAAHEDDVVTGMPATAAAVYDFRDHHTLPRPVLSRPSTPSIIDGPFTSPREEEAPTYPKATSSQPVSRQSSVAHSLSRLAGRPRQPRNQDDDAWLSSDSREKWKNVIPERSRLASRNRSFDRVRHGDSDDQKGHVRPPQLPRSQSHVGFSQVRFPEQRRPPITRKQRDDLS